MADSWYLCIDLKSFYASVECVERGLDPMETMLVVADPERTEKTICLAVSPAMKKAGVKNRCRLFEIPKTLSYITAPPRMQKYIDYAAAIYGIYLHYLSPEDIYVYSIDEAFLDVTKYLRHYGKTPREMAVMLMDQIREELGLQAACGVGTNLYLCKIALDITAKHADDFIGILDENTYRQTLWSHVPLTDFWRIGPGIAARLARQGIYTMGQLAQTDEKLLYRLFGVDAELLIDHAWGMESVSIADIKAYRPASHSINSGQVLPRDYSFGEGKLIVQEMMDLMCLELVEKRMTACSVSLMVGYSNEAHALPARGTAPLPLQTSADLMIMPVVQTLYDRIVDRKLPVRRVYLSCNQLLPEENIQQLTLFGPAADERVIRNHQIQQAILRIHQRFGKNSLLRGMNLQAAATTRERNAQIGGHKSGESTKPDDARRTG